MKSSTSYRANQRRRIATVASELYSNQNQGENHDPDNWTNHRSLLHVLNGAATLFILGYLTASLFTFGLGETQ